MVNKCVLYAFPPCRNLRYNVKRFAVQVRGEFIERNFSSLNRSNGKSRWLGTSSNVYLGCI